jgi:hypothetical protein
MLSAVLLNELQKQTKKLDQQSEVNQRQAEECPRERTTKPTQSLRSTNESLRTGGPVHVIPRAEFPAADMVAEVMQQVTALRRRKKKPTA